MSKLLNRLSSRLDYANVALFVHHLYLAFESVMKLDNLSTLRLTRLLIGLKRHCGRRCGRSSALGGFTSPLNWRDRVIKHSMRIHRFLLI